jgi:transketolase
MLDVAAQRGTQAMETAFAISKSPRMSFATSPAMHAALKAESTVLRRDILEALYRSGGGHYGGCLSVLDIILALYRLELRVVASDPRGPERDRFILSKGHAALALYAVLRHLGFISESLNSYADFASMLEGHPDMSSVAGVDFSTGSLGQGLSVGAGMAYSLKHFARQVWVVLGDGECQEGQVWEAAMLAAACKLDNLHAIIDSNRFQEWGRCASEDESMVPVSNLVEKWQAFGWRALVCNGHDFGELEDAFATARTTSGRPSVIVAHTIKGKGVPMVEAQPQRFHCDSISDAEHQMMVASLGLP